MIKCKRCGKKIPLEAVLEHIEVAHPTEWLPPYAEAEVEASSPSAPATEPTGTDKRVSQE